MDGPTLRKTSSAQIGLGGVIKKEDMLLGVDWEGVCLEKNMIKVHWVNSKNL